MASEYHWTAQEADEQLSDEQLVAYFDAASDRIQKDARFRFAEMVEAVRVGTIVAHDAGEYRRWRSSLDRLVPAKSGRGLRQLLGEAGAGFRTQSEFGH